MNLLPRGRLRTVDDEQARATSTTIMIQGLFSGSAINVAANFNVYVNPQSQHDSIDLDAELIVTHRQILRPICRKIRHEI